ncbi:MAG TPA: tetratricopeptide repeat protein [Steroidobacteraceae bacterium]|nr:tetratricopeptide repeat protein [Steroidobacteraceae bacterium]
MIVFIVLAAVLAAMCMALIAVPLLKPVPTKAARAPWTAIAVAGVLAIGSAGLYTTWSNWSWSKSPGVASPEGMVERLVHRLNDNPDDVDGWLLLGRSYVQLEEYPLAVRAYDRADRVAGGRSAEALIGEANALVLIDDSELTGQASELIERALAVDPNSPQALFFGAAAALRRGNLPLARARFTRLLGLNPPAEVKAILQKQISGIDQQLAAGHPDPSPKSP